MELLIAGLVGVVVGALIAAAVILALLDRRADRDLIERRLRACCEYRECLGDLARALDRHAGEPHILDQAWRNVESFCREYRLTSWLFDVRLRGRLEELVVGLEREERQFRRNGRQSGGRAAQLLRQRYHEVDGILRREVARHEREFRRFRFLPESARDEGGRDDD